MPNYKRVFEPNRYYFLTVVTNYRREILINNIDTLRKAFRVSKKSYIYELFAVVILPEHFHILLRPNNPLDYPKIISTIKKEFTKNLDKILIEEYKKTLSLSKQKKRESGVWHRLFYEHTIKDEKDLFLHLDYIHFNPLKHHLVTKVKDWKYSSFHKFVKLGWYDEEWGDFSLDVDLENEWWVRPTLQVLE